MHYLRPSLVLLALGLSCMPVLAIQKDGGFGKFKKTTITVTAIRAPKVLITQQSFSVEIAGASVSPDMRGQLLNTVQSIVQDARKGIEYAERMGELHVILTVDVFLYKMERVQKPVSVPMKSGKTTVMVVEQHEFARANANFNGSYRLIDRSAGRQLQLDSDTLTVGITADTDVTKGDAPVTEAKFRQAVLETLIEKLRDKLVPAEDTFKVLLADVDGDALQTGNRFAEAGLWQKAFETWNALPPMASPRAEAYRLFNIGVALEALGYETFREKKTASEAVAKFAEAQKFYVRALELKPEEEYFRKGWTPMFSITKQVAAPPPIERIKAAIVSYNELEERMRQLLAVDLSVEPSDGAKSLGGTDLDDAVMTNDSVIRLMGEDFSEEFIREAIKNHKDRKFDLSTNGVIALKRAGVSEAIITFMRQVESPARRPAPVQPKPKRRP